MIQAKNNKTIMEHWKVRLSYGVSDFACNLIWNMLTLYLMYFYTDIAGIASAAVGTMILVTRFGDSFADMFTGILIDKTHSRFGKSRPYIFFGAIPLAIFGVLTFISPNLSMNGKLIYAYITYLGVSISYGIVNIPISSILPSLTRNSVERVNLSTTRMILSFLGATFVSVATLPLVKMLGGYSQAKGFFLTMLVYCLVAVLLLYITFKNVKEKYTVKSEPVAIKRGFKVLMSNKPWAIFALSTLFMWASNFFIQGALIYYFTYVVGSVSQAAIVAGLVNFIPLLGTILAPLLIKYMYKRNIFIFGSLMGAMGLLIILLANRVTGVIYLGTSVYAIGHGIRQNMYFSMQADPVDYSQLKQGVNITGLISAVNGFMGKIAMAVSAGISGFLLSWGHYVPHVHQSAKALMAIKANFIFIPLVMIVLSVFIMYFYNLDKIYPEIQKKLKEKLGE